MTKPSRLSHKPKDKLRYIVYIRLLIVGFFILFILGFYLYSQSAPQLFRTDDPLATYTITKDDRGYYFILYQNDNETEYNKYQDCSYRENGKFICSTVFTKKFTAMVGMSPVDLAPLVGKKVHIKGSFRYGKSQCIVGTCRDLNMLVFNISALNEVD